MTHQRRNIHQAQTTGISTISIPTIIINGKDYSTNKDVNEKLSLPSGYNSDTMNNSFPKVSFSNNSQQRRGIYAQQLNQMENKRTFNNLFSNNNEPSPSSPSLQNLYFNRLSNLNEIKDEFEEECSKKNGILNSNCQSDKIITKKQIGNGEELICCEKPELPNAGLFADNSSSSGSRQNLTGGAPPDRNETNNLPFSVNSPNNNNNKPNNTNLNLKCNGIIPRWFQEFDDFCANKSNPDYNTYCSNKSETDCNTFCGIGPKSDSDYTSEANTKKYEDIKNGKTNMEYKYAGITDDDKLPESCGGCRSYYFLNKKGIKDPTELAYELGFKKKYNEDNSTEINEELKKCQEENFKKRLSNTNFNNRKANEECLKNHGSIQPQNTSEAWKSFCSKYETSCCLDKDFKDYNTLS